MGYLENQILREECSVYGNVTETWNSNDCNNYRKHEEDCIMMDLDENGAATSKDEKSCCIG